MRILHLIPNLSGGGAERQLSLLAPEVAKLGQEVHIAYLNEGTEAISLPGVITHRISVLGNHDPALFLYLLRLVRTMQPHIIQSWILMMDVMAGLLTYRTKGAWILREPTSNAAYKAFSFKKKLRARLAQRAAAIVSNSPGGKLYWLGQRFPEQRLFLIPNIIPFAAINADSSLPKRGEIQKTLLYAGRLLPLKKIDVLLKALAEVRPRRKAVLLIAGEGPERAYLMKLVDNLKLRGAVRLLGYLPPGELWAHMKSADAFISLSEYEGMPNCVCEAIACGTPLILSDISAHRAFLDDKTAILVPIDSVTETAHAILDILERPQEATSRAVRALEAIQDWSPEVIATQYISLYGSLLTGLGTRS